MLTQMRKGASSWPAKILLGVIALSFVIWGMGGVFQDRNVGVVAQVGDEDIGAARLQQAYRAQLQQFQSQGFMVEQGSELSRVIARMALDQLVTDTLYRITARDMGVTINDETVRADIAGNALFHDDQGRFDPARFSMLLQQNGLSETVYIAQVRQQIADSQLQNGIGATPPAPRIMVEPLYAYRNERRVAEIAVVPNDVLAPTVAPAAGELEAFFEEHADRYQAPEYRSADYILLYPDDIAAEMTATDEEALAYYQTNEDRWIEPGRRNVVRLAYATAEEAQAAADRLTAGEAIETVAAETGSDVLDMGSVTRGDLFGALADPIFALDEGAVSDPIPSPLGGFLVVRVDAVEPEVVTPFEEAREEAAGLVRLEKAYDALYDVANDLDNMLASGDTVAEAAETLGVPVKSVTMVDAAGNARDPASLQVIPSAPEFLDELAVGEPEFASPVIETSDDGLLALEVTAVEPGRPLSFEEARDRVAEDWLMERQAELAEKAAQDAVANLAGDAPLGEAFGELGVVARATAPIRRSETPEIQGVGIDAVQALFGAAPGEVIVVPAQGTEAQIVARVVSVEPASAAEDPAGTDELRDTLTSAIVTDLGDQFRAMMRQGHEVSVDNTMLEQIF